MMSSLHFYLNQLNTLQNSATNLSIRLCMYSDNFKSYYVMILFDIHFNKFIMIYVFVVARSQWFLLPVFFPASPERYLLFQAEIRRLRKSQ